MLAAYFDLVRRDGRLVLFAGLVALFSSPGQTFLIGIFAGSFGADLGLSPAVLGSLYSAATLGSAVLYLLVGHWIDRVDLRLFTSLVVLGLAGACLVTAGAIGPASLFAGLLLLRLTGQGLMTHITVTSMARHFGAARGRALSLGAAGFAAGEAVLPALAAFSIIRIGWRQSYVAAALILAIVCLPMLLALIRRNAEFCRATAPARTGPAGWQCLEGVRIVTRTRFFWMMLPLMLIGPLVGTGLIFHIDALRAVSGSSLTVAATAFSAYAACHLIALFCTGPLVDRFSARAVIPVGIVPLLVGLLVMGAVPHAIGLFVLMGTMGMSAAVMSTANGALWAEFYGLERLGSIRTVAMVLMLAGTAGGPVVLGMLMEMGLPLRAIMYGCVGFGLVGIGLALLAPDGPPPGHGIEAPAPF